MNVGWILHKQYLDGEQTAPDIINWLDRHSIPYQLVDCSTKDIATNNLTTIDLDCDILGVLGTIQFVKRSAFHTPKPHHPFFDDTVHKYSSYQHKIQTIDLANANGHILPFSELNRRDFKSLRTLVKSDRMFIKPDNGLKICPAEVVTISDLDRWCTRVRSTYAISDDTLFWVFTRQDIVNEYRCVISDGVAIDGSQYIDRNQIVAKQPKDRIRILDYASSVAKSLKLSDDLYIMDICLLSDGQMKVIELNAFSTSGLYSLNADIWLPAANTHLCRVASSWNI